MPNPLTALFSLQLTILNQCIAMTRGMLELYLSLQPVPVEPARASTSRSLVPLDLPSARRSR